MSQSDSQSKSTYSHLLYLKEADRERYMSNGIPGAWSQSSASSRRSISSTRSTQSVASSNTSVAGSIVDKSTKWADEYYPLITTINPESIPASVPRTHYAFEIARTMVQIHNGLIRAINASYNYALSVQPSTPEAADFLMFNRMIFRTLDHHHHVEDDFFFPELEKLLNRPGAMEENTKGHESFMEGLHLFEKYVTVTKPAEYNGATLRHIIESFGPDLVQHLHDEIPTLANLHVLDSAALKKVCLQAEKAATKDADLYTDAPWLLGCQDKEFVVDGRKCTFPDMPWIIEALVRNWHGKRHSGVWRFCPSDLHGKRRRLTAF